MGVVYDPHLQGHAFSQVLANRASNFCQQIKYLEIRRHTLLPNKSSFNESQSGIQSVGQNPVYS